MARKRNIGILTAEKENLATSYYDYLLQLGYQEKSSKSRYHFIREFLAYQSNREIENTTPKEILEYKHYLNQRSSRNEENKPLSEKYIYSQLQSLKTFFEMLEERKVIAMNPFNSLSFVSLQEETKERIILLQEEIQTLYQVTESNYERTILSLGYGCGLRVGEMENLDLEDIRLDERIVVIRKGKGTKRRLVPMSQNIVNDLKSYLEKEYDYLTRGRNYKANDNAFMLDSRGGRMKYYTYNKYLKRILQRTTIEKEITIHNLRHSIATHLLEQGIRMEQVRLFLGHSQLETTQLYTHISKKQLDEIAV